MSYSVFAFHSPESGCEFKVSTSTPSGREKVYIYLGAVGCKRDSSATAYDHSAGNTYGDVHDILKEFRDDHARVDEDAFAGYSRGRKAAVMSQLPFTPDALEEQNYQATVGFLKGEVELPPGVDREMLLDAWMQGVDVAAFVAGQDSTIAQ